MSNSTAILLAGAMLALALFFGLRSRTAGPIDAPAATPPAEPLHPPAAPPAAPALDPAAARARVANALSYHRDRLKHDCYLPAVVGEDPPPTVAFEFNFTFDPEGMQIARGVVEVARTSRPTITQCVLHNLPPLRIQRPGQIVTATVPLSFP